MSCGFAGSALADTRHGGTSGVSRADHAVSTPAPDEKLIGKKAARKIALADAGVKKKACKNVSVELRRKAGKRVYHVCFTYKKKLRYYYTLNARSGEIVAYYTKCA